jgi:hypothetical protein
MMFIYEQDCTDDALRVGNKMSDDWFLIKVKTADMVSGSVPTTIPESAGYFGDRSGSEIPTSVSVDEDGMISIHGKSNSAVFGATSSSEYTWLYAKTHWDIHYEMNVLSGTYTP